MKKNILFFSACFCAFAMSGFAQSSTTTAYDGTEAQQELKAYMDEGLLKFGTKDGKVSFRVGGRLVMDGAHYLDDYTDRGSGAKITSARIRIISQIGSNLDFKFDYDFADQLLKDAYIRWHSNKNGFVRVGNFAEPFSAENIQSTFDYPFINKSATVGAFGTGRAVGISYRYYHPYFWGEAGVFSQKYANEYHEGDMGYSASARLLGRMSGEDWSFHVGGSVNFRRPDANGYSNGSDDYNRSVTVSSNLESSIDDKRFISATLNNVKNVFKFGVEMMGNYKNLYVKGEYIQSRYFRERDWESTWQSYQGSLMAPYFPTVDALKSFMGTDKHATFHGATVEAGWLILGGDYRYSNVEAMMSRPKAKSLELVARFNHTDLNCIQDGSIFFNNGFYDNESMMNWGITNQTVVGGRVNTLTVGLNYYITNNIYARVNYSYQHLNNPFNTTYALDKDLHSFQARLAFEF